MLNVSNIGIYSIAPLASINTNRTNVSMSSFIGAKKPINLNLQPAVVAFKGYVPEAHLRYGINKLANLIKSDSVKKIAFLSHAHPDCDAIGSMVAGKNEIKEATGKIADIFVMKPLHENQSSLDPDNEFKIITNIFQDSKKLAKQIQEKFGTYDLVIVTDTPFKKLLDKELDDGLLKTAKKVAKIDHHPLRPEDTVADYEYGDINIIDANKDSASQIVMQLAKPLGLDPKNINPKISDAIASGLVTDSDQFRFAKNEMSYKDAAKLQSTTNIGKIAKEANSINISEFELLANIMGNVKFSPAKDIAYFIIGKEQSGSAVKNANITALNTLSRIRGVKYYFSIIESPNESGRICSSLRSNDKPINKIAGEYGGGGHDKACGFSTKVENIDEFVQNLINKLNELKSS